MLSDFSLNSRTEDLSSVKVVLRIQSHFHGHLIPIQVGSKVSIRYHGEEEEGIQFIVLVVY